MNIRPLPHPRQRQTVAQYDGDYRGAHSGSFDGVPAAARWPIA